MMVTCMFGSNPNLGRIHGTVLNYVGETLYASIYKAMKYKKLPM